RFVQQVNEDISFERFEPNEQVLQRLVAGLGDPRGVVRLRFAETLGQIGEVATPHLITALEGHSDVVLRRAAAKTLTLIADPAAVPTLVNSFLNDEDTVVRGSSVGALARTGVTAVPELLKILGNPEHRQEIKGHAAWALAFIGAEATEYLFEALNNASLDVRCAVIGALGHVAQENSDEKVCQLLVAALDDQEALIRTEAAAVLGQINYPPSVEPLIRGVNDPDLDVRKAAINSLGKIGDPRATEPLKELLEDEDPAVKVLAKLAIAQMERDAQGEDGW
ncbi:MAG: HEAT repeat domain-containing protein, partial [Cyanobacteria bacterium P01_H01_bin.15]